MEFLCSFLRHHLVGKQAVASAKVGCFLRLTQILHTTGYLLYSWVAYVVVNFLFQLIFVFPLFWGMVMYANEFKTKKKQKLTEIKS